ncbi:CRTAC1 family protein [Nucisporomicrobium flavum]|uniref:CRTAC1 family protein n=1 Tax=Nucisporomicrobium flavum TaxID=2785915 RepID=UPI003C2E72BD
MSRRWDLRPALAPALAVALCVGVGWATRAPAAAGDPDTLARRFSWAVTDVNGDPPAARTERAVEPALRHIRAWISAVGASAGLADLDGNARPDDVCLVDPRDDAVTVLPAPGTGARYAAFPLVPGPPGNVPAAVAPMGCMPGDLNEDGLTDVLVYFWGRAPLAFLRVPGTPLAAAAFRASDVTGGSGEVWNSTTADLADLDGDGHLDLLIGNYFPDGARVLDASAHDDPLIRMQDSMSNATNGGRNRILRLDHVDRTGPVPVPRYADASAAFADDQARSWTLAFGAQDLDGDGLPELYTANDFGRDHLLHNRSTPGHIAFTELRGRRSASMPKSKVIGNDSFKSMGVAFPDLNADGRPDIVVSNITTQWGLQESNFAYVSTGTGPIRGRPAPYTDRSEPLGLSRSGWGWDIKAADFDNDGTDELIQAVGFVAGRGNDWPQLQELAMTNDDVLRFPWSWPNFGPGTDIAGHQRDPFFVRDADGRYVDIGERLGIANAGPSRGIAVADVDHDGRADVLLANQWARSQFLRNTGPAGAYLGLRPLLPATAPGGHPRPAIGAAVTVTRADGRVLRQQLYPANGHTGVNGPELLFGLGAAADAPVSVTVTWRDASGPHTTTTSLSPGWHDLVLA